MADNFFKVNRGVNLNPQIAPSSPINGDFYFDSVSNTYAFNQNGSWINLASVEDVASATNLTSTQFTAAVVQNPLVRVTGATASNIHGLLASSDGKQVVLYNAASVNVVIKNQSGTEGTAANRIKTSSGSDLTLTPGQSTTLAYDGAQSRWILVGGSGGGLQQVEAAIANNQSSPANVTGFLLDSAESKAFSAEMAIVRRHSGGVGSPISEDTAFYTNLGTAFSGPTNFSHVQSDNKILVAGNFATLNGNTRNGIARFNSNGIEDATFAANTGTGFLLLSSSINLRTIKELSTGKILCGGNFDEFNGNTRNRLVQLNNDGTEDTAFYTNLGSGFSSAVERTVEQSDGKIIVSGLFTTFNSNSRTGLVRLNANGTEDTAFYTNLGSGFAVTPNLKVTLQVDQRILVYGNFTSLNGNTRNRLVRLNSDGTEDTAFYTNLGTAFNDTVLHAMELESGKIIVGGSFTTFNGNTRNGLILLNSDGTEDTAFYTNLGAGIGASSGVYSVIEQPDNKLVCVGSFTTLDGNTRNRAFRLNSDGTEDTAFYTTLGTGFDGIVFWVDMQSTGELFMTGQFTDLNGNTRNRLVKFNQSFLVSTELIQQRTIKGVYRPSSSAWETGAETYFGDDTGVTLSITAGGQVQYTSTNLSGTLVESLIRFIIIKT